MNRNKIALIAAAVVAAALLAAGGVILGRSLDEVGNARQAREASLRSLKSLYEAKPFPSMDNARRVEREVEGLAAMRGTMTNALSAYDVPRPALSPSRFIQELQTALRDRLVAKAPIVEGVRAVPENFAFGFGSYMAPGAPMPRESDVPRLAQQLAMVEALVSEVYASQIGRLIRLERDEFDMPETGTAAEGTGRLRRSRTTAAAATAPEGLVRTRFYSAERFTLEVSGRQSTIGSLLNRLAAGRLFVIVTDVSLVKSGEDLRPPQAPEAAPGLAATPGPAATEAAVTVPTGVSKLPPSQRLVSGPRIDTPLRAVIELQICNFKPEGV